MVQNLEFPFEVVPLSETDNNHPIIQQTLSKDKDIQPLVDLDIFEDGDDGHRIDSADNHGEREERQHGDVLGIESEGHYFQEYTWSWISKVAESLTYTLRLH